MAHLKAKDRRRHLFDIYARNLTFHSTSVGNLFMCPICGPAKKEVFGPDAITGPDIKLDLAHTYPSACGGKLETLTCKSCNNRIGGRFDQELIKERRVHDAFDPTKDAFVKARLKSSVGEVGILFSVGQDTTRLKVVAEHTNPTTLRALEHSLKNSTAAFLQGANLDIEMDWFSERRASLALWHSAFLMMFREFGYEFALSPIAERMRGHLLANEPPTEHFFQSFAIPKESFDNRGLNRIAIVTSPRDFRSFVATVPTPDQKFGGRCVLVPGLGEAGEAAYQRIMSHRGTNVRLRCTLIGGHSRNRLTRRAFSAYMRFAWADVPVDGMLRQQALISVWDASGKAAEAPVAVASVGRWLGLSPDLVCHLLQELQSANCISGNAEKEGEVWLTREALEIVDDITSRPG